MSAISSENAHSTYKQDSVNTHTVTTNKTPTSTPRIVSGRWKFALLSRLIRPIPALHFAKTHTPDKSCIIVKPAQLKRNNPFVDR